MCKGVNALSINNSVETNLMYKNKGGKKSKKYRKSRK